MLGTIEEKIFQRQAHKQALSSCVVDEEEDVERHFAMKNLRDLFKLNEETLSETHDAYKCKRCVNGMAINVPFMKPSIDNDDSNSNDDNKKEKEEVDAFDMSKWSHYSRFNKVEDSILKQAMGNDVTFLFHNQFD